ncbi:oligosaccharide flippase family protein [Micromonospora sp. NBC_01405]|uniref:lipopolysaccharide biosynthesis protein n=1 Tax=Micromonospora sp. NBC_01405 TaxID=2903589 RepID=UPI003254F187
MPSVPAGLVERERPPPGAHRRAPDRTRRLVTGVCTAVLSRLAGFVVPIVLVPVTLPYLGTDLYGLWMAVAALAGMAAFADLGLGSGLMTKLAPCQAAGDHELARRYVSSAYLTLSVLAVALCGVLWLIADAVPWASVFNTTGQITPGQARTIALTCLTAFVLNVPLSLIVRVQYACQQVGRSNLWQAGAGLVGLLVVLGIVRAGLPPVAIIVASAAAPLVVNLLNSLWFFWRDGSRIRPRLRCVDPRAARELLSLSGLFFVVTVVTSVATSVDTLIVAHALGLSAVAAYVVPAKLLAQLGQLVVLVNVPLWPANGDALARGQLAWVRRITRRMTVVSVLATLLPTVVLAFAGQRLLDAWLPVPIGADPWLLAGLGGWWVVQAALSPRFMVQNAAGVVTPQLVGWAVFAVLSLVGKWYGASWFGLWAVPWVAVGGFALTVVPAALYGYRKALRRPGRPASEWRSDGQLVG